MKNKIYYKKLYSGFKKKPILMSKDIMRFRVRISKKLKHYKSRMFRRYKRFSYLQKRFFRRAIFRARRRSDLLFLYKKRRFYSRWIPKRYFSRKKSKKFERKFFFIKRMREKFLRVTNWRNRIKKRYYRKTPRLYATSPFRYQLLNERKNRKKFLFWINKRFFGKRKRFVFRIFYFFRKLEKIRFNFKTKTVSSKALVSFNSNLFFEKYRKFSLWALSYSWYKFYPRSMRRLRRKLWLIRKKKKQSFLRIKNRLKRFRNKKLKNRKIKKKKYKSFKKKLKKKRYKEKSRFAYTKKYTRFKFSHRKFTRKRSFRKFRQISRFLQVTKFAYKFPHNKRFFKVKSVKNLFNKSKFFNSNKVSLFGKKNLNILYDARPHPYKFFKFFRPSRGALFQSKRRLPRLFYKNFFYKKNLPLGYYFTRGSKKYSVYFKTFKKKINISRFLKFKHRSRIPFRVKRIFNKLRFYLSKVKRSRFSVKLNKKIFFVRRKYSMFLPYLGYFRRFGRKRFIYKRKRKKFFRFFKKFFSKFHSVSAIITPRSKFYKKQASKIRLFIHIFRSVNNIFVNVSAPRGRTLYAYSAGRTHFRGSKRLSPVAIETMGKSVSLLLKNSKIFQVGVVFHTPIDYLVRALMRGFRTNIKFTHFKYHITKPHNGLRLRATRRI